MLTWSVPPLCLAGLLLAGYAAAALWRPRLRPGQRNAALGLAVLLAGAAHLRLLDRAADGGLGLQLPPPQLNEYWHYYVGTKYFAELGYQGLYAAGVVADAEDDPEGFQPDAPVRDLTTYRLVPRGSVLAHAGEIKAGFTPERWLAFKRDVALLRGATRPGFWHARGYSVDHGYNATPLVTLLLGGLANQPWLEAAAFVALTRWLDLYLLLLLGVVVAALEGAAAGLTLLFFVFANPLNDAGFVGSAYLRSPWLVGLGLALVALRMRWLAAAGALFAFAGWLRIFPLLLPALLGLRDLWGRDRTARLRAHARLYTAFGLTSLAILAATSLGTVPGGGSPWRAFAANMQLHAGTFGANQIGLQVPFRYSAAKDGRGDAARPDWRRETARVLAERRGAYRATALLLVALAAISLRRVAGAAVLLPGLLILVAALPLAHYYWAVLGLVPLAVGWDRRVRVLLALTMLALTITALPLFLEEAQDLRFSWMSLEVTAFLVAGCALSLRGGQAALPLAAACLVLAACSPSAPEPTPDEASGAAASTSPEDRIQGDVWQSRALGLRLEKPPDWVFLPGSSLLEDADARIEDPTALWSRLRTPALTPLVTIAAPEAEDGAGPELRAYAIPPRPQDSEWAVSRLRKMEPVAVLTTNIGARKRQLVDFEELEPPAPAQVGGLAGAAATLGYALPESGARVVERRWHLKRGATFFYFEGVAPEPLAPGIEEEFERIIASVRLEP